jgi:hypothetical protein
VSRGSTWSRVKGASRYRRGPIASTQISSISALGRPRHRSRPHKDRAAPISLAAAATNWPKERAVAGRRLQPISCCNSRDKVEMASSSPSILPPVKARSCHVCAPATCGRPHRKLRRRRFELANSCRSHSAGELGRPVAGVRGPIFRAGLISGFERCSQRLSTFRSKTRAKPQRSIKPDADWLRHFQKRVCW